MFSDLLTRGRAIFRAKPEAVAAPNAADLSQNGATAPAPALGLVEKIKPAVVRGWVIDPDAKSSPIVEIVVNGRVVGRTVACQPKTINGETIHAGFARKLRGLWKFLGPKDTIEVRCAGRVLPIVDHGYRYRYAKAKKKSRLNELFGKLDQGFVFNKYGVLALSIQRDLAWQKGITTLFWELRDKLKQEFGVDLQVTYGTLLSAIRDGNFIGHDNDFDTCYISRHKTPKKVRAEFIRICEFLIDAGYQVKVKKSHTWVMVPGTDYKMDIFFSWFSDTGEYQASYGYHGPEIKRSSAFFRMKEVKLGAYTVSAPEASEELLCHFYGPGWRVPDPGFSHYTATRKLGREFLLRPTQVSRMYWKQHYRDATKIPAESSFARFVRPQISPDALVVEFGCGNGRDALFFAREGLSVLGGDRCEEAIARGREAAAQFGERCTLQVVDAGKAEALETFLAQPQIAAAKQAGREVVVYMRFFLHVIPQKYQDRIFKTLIRRLGGAKLCVEFRTDKDRPVKKRYKGPYRRFMKASDFKSELAKKWGMNVQHFEQATGWAPTEEEDPHLCRVIAVLPSAG